MRAWVAIWLCVLIVAVFVVAVVARNRQAADASVSADADLAGISGYEPADSSAPVRDVLAQYCATARCHGQGTRSGGQDLSPGYWRGNLVGITSLQMPSHKLVVPGDPQHSYLMDKLGGEKGIRGGQMPLGAVPLSPEEQKLVEDWIAAGAAE